MKGVYSTPILLLLASIFLLTSHTHATEKPKTHEHKKEESKKDGCKKPDRPKSGPKSGPKSSGDDSDGGFHFGPVPPMKKKNE